MKINDYKLVMENQAELIKKCGFLINGQDNKGSLLTLLTDIEIHVNALEWFFDNHQFVSVPHEPSKTD